MYQRLINRGATNRSGKTEMYVSESIKEFADAVRNGKADPKDQWSFAQMSGSERKLGRDFGGDLDRVLDACTEPWEDGLRVILKMRDQIKGSSLRPPKSRKRRFRWNEETGDELDIDRLRSGQPWWRDTKRVPRVGMRRISSLADLSADIHKTSDEVMWRGAAAVIASELLEAAGYRVSLWVGRYSDAVWRDGTGQCMLIRLKHFNDRINMSTLASAVSAWFLRGVIFSAYRLNPTHGGVKPGLGFPSNISIFQDYVEKNQEDLIVMRDVWTEQDAVSLIRRSLERVEQQTTS